MMEPGLPAETLGRSSLLEFSLKISLTLVRFLCTSSVSDIFYSTISHFVDHGSFKITKKNLPFFNRLHPQGKAVIGTYRHTEPEFKEYLETMFTYADSFLNVIRWHATKEGRLSEQFDGRDGFQKGARDLTWSYGSFLMAVDKREKAREMLFGA
jgi:glucoamylase